MTLNELTHESLSEEEKKVSQKDFRWDKPLRPGRDSHLHYFTTIKNFFPARVHFSKCLASFDYDDPLACGLQAAR